MRIRSHCGSALSVFALLALAVPADSTVFSESDFYDIDVFSESSSAVYDPLNFDILHTGQPAVGIKCRDWNSPLFQWFNLYGSNGDGTFSVLGEFIEMPDDATYFNISGDISGDGYSDLLTFTDDLGPYYIHLSVPGGGLGDPYTFTPSIQTQIRGVGEIDDDLYPDLYGTCGGSVVVWFGTESEDFEIVEVMPGSNAVFASAGDLDLDGDIDIIFTDESGIMHILQNDGDRAFTEIGEFSPGYDMFAAALPCDLNGNGYLDIVVLYEEYPENGLFGTYINNCSPSMEFTFTGLFMSAQVINFFTPIDLNMDGLSDLAVLSGEDIYLYEGTGGVFVYEPHLFSLPNVEPMSMTFNDYDGDGDPDMICVVGDEDAQYLRCYWNTTYSQGCEGGSQIPPSVSLAALSNPFCSGVTIVSTGGFSPVQLEILDISGRTVNTILPESTEQYYWDGTSLNGERAPAGVYLVRGVLSGSSELLKLVKLN